MLRAITVAVLLALFIASLTAAPVPKEINPPGPFFPAKLGTAWAYRGTFPSGEQETTEVILESETKDGETRFSVGCALNDNGTGPRLLGADRFVAKADGLFLLEQAGAKYDPPLCILKLPLRRGDSWKVSVLRGEEKVEGNFTVGKELEEVAVPAGKFRAYRVERRLVSRGKEEAIYWYAPGVGVVKKVGSPTNPKYRNEHVLKCFGSDTK
jgi:hypothetical protein